MNPGSCSFPGVMESLSLGLEEEEQGHEDCDSCSKEVLTFLVPNCLPPVIPSPCSLRPCSSKWGAQTGNTSITGDLVSKVNSQPDPCAHQNLQNTVLYTNLLIPNHDFGKVERDFKKWNDGGLMGRSLYL